MFSPNIIIFVSSFIEEIPGWSNLAGTNLAPHIFWLFDYQMVRGVDDLLFLKTDSLYILLVGMSTVQWPLATRHPSHPVTTTNRNMAAKALRLDQHGHIAKYIWMFEKQLNMNMNMNWPLNVVYVSCMTKIVIFRGWGQTVPRSYWDRNIETVNCF